MFSAVFLSEKFLKWTFKRKTHHIPLEHGFALTLIKLVPDRFKVKSDRKKTDSPCVKSKYSTILFQIISFQPCPERFQGLGSPFFHSEGFSSVGRRAKGPNLSTGANVNTAIPSQLETLNALDSVHHRGWPVQLMQPRSPLAALDGWDS